MGQTWCKNKSSMAPDSKSPLDRVFLRCAQRIYPGLKTDGSVLGSASQRVTSSEIGYAGSPPRELLTRGRSDESIDRPFQLSDWIDVNLEVPSTPCDSSVMKNVTKDTVIYPITTPALSHLRNIIPIPPPRRKKNFSRPYSPNSKDSNSHCYEVNIKSLYSSVIPSIQNRYVKNKSEIEERKCTNDIYKHKINSTERVISSTMVSGWKSAESISNRQKSPEICKSNLKNISTVSLPNYDEWKVSKHRALSEKINNNVIGSNESHQNYLKFMKPDIDEIKLNRIVQRHIHNDALDNSIEIADRLKLQKCNTSTSMIRNEKKLNNTFDVDVWSLNAVRSSTYPESISVQKRAKKLPENAEKEFAELKSGAHHYFISGRNKSWYSDLFCKTEDEKKTNSLDRYRVAEPLKNHRRTLSNEGEPFDRFDGRRSSIKHTYCHEVSPKLLAKSISQESFPSALMEDPDETDVFDEKIVEDTKNEITKIREELEAMQNEVKTPPHSPEPIIQPELQRNDHSTLLIDRTEEAGDSNLSSMTPSLTELEAALSDMLEQEEHHGDIYVDMREDRCESLLTTKPLEKLMESNVVPFIAEEEIIEMADIDLQTGKSLDDLSSIRATFYELKLLELNSTKNDYENIPEKPRRLNKIRLNSLDGHIPIPPQRRNRSMSHDPKHPPLPDYYSNDRLI